MVRCGPPSPAEALRQATWAAAREALPPARTADCGIADAAEAAVESVAAAADPSSDTQADTRALRPDDTKVLEQ